MALLQDAHLPRSKAKLTRGISSYHDNCLEQEKQKERLPMPRPVPRRKTKTFKKLPIMAPRAKVANETKISMSLHHTTNPLSDFSRRGGFYITSAETRDSIRANPFLYPRKSASLRFQVVDRVRGAGKICDTTSAERRACVRISI